MPKYQNETLMNIINPEVKAFNEKSPTRVKCSLYEYARSKATDEPETWSDLHYVYNELVNNPDWYALNKTKHHEVFQRLMLTAIDDVDIAFGTPVALAELTTITTGFQTRRRLNENTSL
ncbi:uncharacterized protein FRV6_02086 [Fusarium oxysporum]|uniref:Uncharacterized protein n=1 Tax=Fusarium oxysporum TaxID=5507 RepID=A0A2H3SZK2_FUSOX|nr:uncharacterized protein FRV6_02086 [Fusarium oxysporum]